MKNAISILMFFSVASLSAQANEIGHVYPPGYSVNGHTAEDLSAKWWQWSQSIPRAQNPVRDEKGILCGQGQQGPVWFLAGGFGSAKIQRSCLVPYGKHIFFPIVNMAFWPSREGLGYTCEKAQRDAAINNDGALELFVELNGVAVESPKRYRARSYGCFNILERAPAGSGVYDAYPSASDGYWILLKPLPKGAHVLKFGGRYASPNQPHGRMVQDIEYQLIVQ